MKDLTLATKGLTQTDDIYKTQGEHVNILYGYIKQKIDSNSLVGADKDIVAEAECLELKEKCLIVLVELLFDAKIQKQIKEHRKFLLKFCHNSPN